MPPTAAQVKAVERLVHESVQAVDALAPAALNAVLPALKAARDELAADLQKWMQDHPDGGETFTAFQKKQALLALESSFARIAELQPAMATALGMGRKATGGLAVTNLEHEVQRLSSIFGGGMVVIPQINTAAVIAKGDKLLFKQHASSSKRYAGGIGDDIRVRMSVSLAKGDTFEQMVQRLRGSSAFRSAVKMSDPGASSHLVADAMFNRWRHWADRLVRTENMHAYNTQHDLSIEHVNANRSDDDEEYLRRWDATADRVTCPRCAALDRTLATIKGDFAGGVHSPPLHPYCRCVVLAWLARWGNFRGEVPAAETFHDVGEAKRRDKAATEAKQAAAEDIAAFDKNKQADEESKKKQSEWDAKVAAAKAKQAKLAAEVKAKLAAEKAALEQKLAAEAKALEAKIAAEKAAAEAAAKKAAEELAAKLAAQKAAAEAAAKAAAAEAAAKLAAEQKAAAELAKKLAEDQAKLDALEAQKKAEAAAAKAQKLANAKAKKEAKLAAGAAPFEPETSGTIGYIPKGKAKGKEHLLAKPGMVQVTADKIVGHGYEVHWDSDAGKWVTQKGPADLGYTYSHGAQKWTPKTAAQTAAPAPAATKPATPAPIVGPQPAAIKGYEWKQINGGWVLHQGSTPTSALVKPQTASSPMLKDTYSLGGDLASHGLVPTAPGVMEGHGYKFAKDASGTWQKIFGPVYVEPGAVNLGAHGDGEQLTENAFAKYRSTFGSQINGNERAALLRYSGSSYTSINGALRKGRPQDEAETIKHMDAGLAKAKLDKPILMHRGVYGSEMERMFGSLKPGDKFTEAAYVSTSAFSGSAFGGNVKFSVTVPAGFNAGAIPSHFSNEKEFLLPRGTEFEVTGVTKSGGKTTLHVRVVSQPGVTPKP